MPDRRVGFIEEVHRIIPLVRKEKGCIRYELASDVYNPDIFLFIEEWESQRHLDEHLECPHMIAYFAKTNPWQAAPPELTVYEIKSFTSATL